VVLVRLDNVEVRTLALREAVLAVELQLGSDNGVLAPAVHVEGSLGKDECSSIGETRGSHRAGGLGERGLKRTRGPFVVGAHISSTGHLEETGSSDELVSARCLSRSTEGVDGRRESINGVGVVEGLGTECAEKDGCGIEGRAVVDVGIRLDNPDELLARVVEVQLDLVGRGTNRLVTSELELLDEVLVGVLGHLAALVSVEEDIVDVQRGSNKGLLVGGGHGLCAGGASEGLDGPQALTNRAEVNVDLDLVVLEGDEGKSKARVAAEPEEKRDVEGGLRERLAGSTHLGRATGSSARTGNVGEGGVSDVGELGGVADHLVVTRSLLGCECKLVPDVHPVTVVAVNALATNLDLDLGNELFTDVIQPTGIDASGRHILVNLRESNLEVCAVAQITISANSAGHTATKVSLTREGLLDGLHREVGVSAV